MRATGIHWEVYHAVVLPVVPAMAEESGLPQQIRAVERSVVFLRQEHLTLLHGLHLEILSLQKRCSGEAHKPNRHKPLSGG